MGQAHATHSALWRWLTGLGLVLLAAGVWLGFDPSTALAWRASGPHALVLLIPDEAALAHPVTQAWLEAAQEEGLPVTPMTSNRFVQAVAAHEALAGVLVPDTVHRHASDVWVQALQSHVRGGGRVLLSFDAGIFGLDQPRYAAPVSRLSALTGYHYAMYEALQEETTAVSAVQVSREAMHELAIQPGKVDFGASGQDADTGPGAWGELTTYGYPHLMYPHFRTQAAKPDRLWMRTADGDPLLSLHAFGQGQVLFANVPLGYLQTRTDGYLLHRLLGYFGGQLARLPTLSPVPDGVGGLVLNLHLDSNAAEQPMLALEQSGFFLQGPFSIHITAGPDSFRIGDRLGLDMRHNPRMQSLLRRLQAQGHEIGNHGGWIHNVFGEQASDDNADRFTPWLELNQQTLAAIAGKAPLSYSAPMGNHPAWVTRWLQRQGLRAYYTAGDSGLGPTRAHRPDPTAPTDAPWAFPISNLHRIATFEELEGSGIEERTMVAFVRALAAHVSAQGIARLFYFHPASAAEHLHSLQALQQTAQALEQAGTFRWYTMQRLSAFLDRRHAVQWQLHTGAEGRGVRLQAMSPQSLREMTWVLPKSGVSRLRIRHGQARIAEGPAHWRVTAGDVHQLTLEWEPMSR